MTESNKKVGETSNGEVVNGFRSCRDLSDIVPLYTARSLYLKPVAKINVSVNLPQLKTPGNTISTWEVMEKIRMLIRPDEFASLKVTKSTLEFIRLEGDLRDRCRLQRVLARLDSQRLNLTGFSNFLKVRAAEAKDDFPTRHSWDSYFRDAKHMNELKPGERPDTLHIQGLPVKWFCEEGSETPDESLVAKIFKKWGTLRRIDVPAADLYRSKMRLGSNIKKFTFGEGIFFDAYVQYIEYMDFVKAMGALRGMKLMKKDGQNYLTAALKVDFDKTKHMSDASVSQREFERKRLIAQENLAAEKQRRKEEADAKKREEQKKKEDFEATAKESRRKKREEKRKRKALTVFRKQEEDKVSMKIAKEEKKLIKAQRQLESIRLLDELFDRIKTKIERKEIDINKENSKEGERDSAERSDDSKKEKKAKKKKNKKEKKKKKKKKKRKKKKGSGSSSESDSEVNKKIKNVLTRNVPHEAAEGPALDPSMSYPSMYPRFPQPWYYDGALPMFYPQVGRGGSRGGRFGRNRGRGNFQGRQMNNRSMRGFNPHLYNEQYYKYFANLAGQDYHSFESDYDRSPPNIRSRRRSISRSRSRSRRRRRRSDSRSKSRSRSHSRRRSRTHSRSRSRTRSKSRSRARSKSRSKSKSRSRSKSRSMSKSKSRSRTKSKSRSRRSGRTHSRSRSRRSSRSQHKRKRSESQVKITRAKSRATSPRGRSRSSTWSLPKSPRQRSCSWSKEADAADTERKQKEKTERGDGAQEINNKEGNNKERSNKEDKKENKVERKENNKKDDSRKEIRKEKSESSRSEGTKESSKDEVRSEAPAS